MKTRLHTLLPQVREFILAHPGCTQTEIGAAVPDAALADISTAVQALDVYGEIACQEVSDGRRLRRVYTAIPGKADLGKQNRIMADHLDAIAQKLGLGSYTPAILDEIDACLKRETTTRDLYDAADFAADELRDELRDALAESGYRGERIGVAGAINMATEYIKGGRIGPDDADANTSKVIQHFANALDMADNSSKEECLERIVCMGEEQAELKAKLEAKQDVIDARKRTMDEVLACFAEILGKEKIEIQTLPAEFRRLQEQIATLRSTVDRMPGLEARSEKGTEILTLILDCALERAWTPPREQVWHEDWPAIIEILRKHAGEPAGRPAGPVPPMWEGDQLVVRRPVPVARLSRVSDGYAWSTLDNRTNGWAADEGMARVLAEIAAGVRSPGGAAS